MASFLIVRIAQSLLYHLAQTRVQNCLVCELQKGTLGRTTTTALTIADAFLNNHAS